MDLQLNVCQLEHDSQPSLLVIRCTESPSSSIMYSPEFGKLWLMCFPIDQSQKIDKCILRTSRFVSTKLVTLTKCSTVPNSTFDPCRKEDKANESGMKNGPLNGMDPEVLVMPRMVFKVKWMKILGPGCRPTVKVVLDYIFRDF